MNVRRFALPWYRLADVSRPAAALVAGGLIAAAMILGGSAVFLTSERNHDVNGVDRELSSLSVTLAEEIDRSFLALRTVQRGLIERLRFQGIDTESAFEQRMATAAIHSLLQEEIKGLPFVDGIAVISANGTLINSSQLWPIPVINVDGSGYFKALHESNLDQFVSGPVRDRTTGESTIVFAQRIAAEDGQFLGLVTAAVDISYFEEFFRHVEPGPGGAIVLFRSDGTLLARYPHDREMAGASYASPAFLGRMARNDGKVVWLRSPIDGRERIVTHNVLRYFPLMIGASMTSAAALADWRRELAVFMVLDAVALAAIGSALYIVARSLNREVRKAHERLEQAIETLPEGLMIFDSADRLAICNSAMRKVVPACADHYVPGTSFENFLRRNLAVGIYGNLNCDTESWVAERVAEYRTGGGATRELPLSNGRWLRAEDRRTPDHSTVCIRIDITDLKEREASFKMMFDDNPVPMWVFDRDNLRFLEVNKAATEHYGYSREQFLAMTIADIRPPQDVEALQASLRTGYDTAQHWDARQHRGAWRHRRADGSLIDVNVIASRMRFHRQDAELVAVFDITEHNLALAAAHSARAEAESANRMKSQFLATMSHELRTPLNAILGFSEIINTAAMGPIDQKYRNYAGDIHSSGSHLLHLISDILDLSKIEAGRSELHEEPVDMAEIVETCVDLVAAKARQSNIELGLVAAAEIPLVCGDSLRLKQVVLNVLTNAVKFTEPGGRVVMAASAPVGEGLSLEVRDTGIGMRPEDIPIALEPFRQVDGAWNRRYEGTGLGLPLAHKLIQLHGGTLTIESTPGHGTMVLIRLPESRLLRGSRTQTVRQS